jgi:RNA polymerase sigma factor (sigma-70 family)
MASRWFFGPHSDASSSSDEDDKVRPLPSAMSDSWRTWVMTGARKGPTDRRRVRGAHRDLKKMLVEGVNGGAERQHPWQDFSSAMIRQSVDHAVNSLPDEQKQMVKLAYFGGLSNQEIAARLGIPVGGVRRRLRQALAAVSDYVERGQAAGRRAVYAIAGWLTARSIFGSGHRSGPLVDPIVQTAAAVTVGVVAAAVLVAHPVSLPGQHPTPAGAGSHVSAPAGASAAQGSKPAVPAVPSVTVPKSLPGTSTTVPDATKGITLPVIGKVKVKDPSPLPTPSVNGVPIPKRLNG